MSKKKAETPSNSPQGGEIFIVLTVKASFRTQRDSILNTEFTELTKHFRKVQQATQVRFFRVFSVREKNFAPLRLCV